MYQVTQLLLKVIWSALASMLYNFTVTKKTSGCKCHKGFPIESFHSGKIIRVPHYKQEILSCQAWPTIFIRAISLCFERYDDPSHRKTIWWDLAWFLITSFQINSLALPFHPSPRLKTNQAFSNWLKICFERQISFVQCRFEFLMRCDKNFFNSAKLN